MNQPRQGEEFNPSKRGAACLYEQRKPFYYLTFSILIDISIDKCKITPEQYTEFLEF
jgi:hypothetical protein